MIFLSESVCVMCFFLFLEVWWIVVDSKLISCMPRGKRVLLLVAAMIH